MAVALTAAAVLALASQYPGWDAEQVVWLAQKESSYRPDVINTKGPWYGLLQIGEAEGRQYGATPDQLLEPETNIRVGYALWQARGWQPWPVAASYVKSDVNNSGSIPGKAVTMPYPPDEQVTVTSWLKAPRPAGMTPRIIIIHATRGSNTQALQYQATKGWFQSTSNGSAAQGWGGCATVVIGSNGELCRFMNEASEVPRYSAGYGSNLPPQGWCADDWGLSMELAQSDKQEAFAAATIDRAAMQAALWCQTYNISPVHLGTTDQRGASPASTGIVGHDELENGRKLGKSDPGAQFPWPAFMAKVSYYMGGQVPQEDDDMPAEHYAGEFNDRRARDMLNWSLMLQRDDPTYKGSKLKVNLLDNGGGFVFTDAAGVRTEVACPIPEWGRAT